MMVPSWQIRNLILILSKNEGFSVEIHKIITESLGERTNLGRFTL